jgi:hypothetical protein
LKILKTDFNKFKKSLNNNIKNAKIKLNKIKKNLKNKRIGKANLKAKTYTIFLKKKLKLKKNIKLK